ncbi:MAG: amidohydrolase [Armatimonadetes bacterium]|nr:amidohydrolase [Armatimonadota bacterium]
MTKDVQEKAIRQDAESEDAYSRQRAYGRRDFLKWAGLSVAAASLLGEDTPTGAQTAASTPEETLASLPRYDRMEPIIDVHMHAVENRLEGLKGTHPEAGLPVADVAARFQAILRESGTGLLFGMGAVNGGTSDPLGLKATLTLAERIPELRVIGIIDPRQRDKAYLKAVEAQIERERGKLVAFKAYLGYLNAYPADRGYQPYYRLAAQYGLPVVFHTGDVYSTKGLLKYAHPLGIDEVAVAYPKVQFVLAHFGCPWYWDATEMLWKNDNVWADLSGQLVTSSAEAFRKTGQLPPWFTHGLVPAMESTGYDRILYGSDYPVCPMALYRWAMEKVIPPDQHAKVFRENAAKLFQVPVQRAFASGTGSA